MLSANRANRANRAMASARVAAMAKAGPETAEVLVGMAM